MRVLQGVQGGVPCRAVQARLQDPGEERGEYGCCRGPHQGAELVAFDEGHPGVRCGASGQGGGFSFSFVFLSSWADSFFPCSTSVPPSSNASAPSAPRSALPASPSPSNTSSSLSANAPPPLSTRGTTSRRRSGASRAGSTSS